MRSCAYDKRLGGTIEKNIRVPFGEQKIVKLYSHSMPLPVKSSTDSTASTEEEQDVEVLQRCLIHYGIVIELELLYNKIFNPIPPDLRATFSADLIRSFKKELSDARVTPSKSQPIAMKVYEQNMFILKTPLRH